MGKGVSFSFMHNGFRFFHGPGYLFGQGLGVGSANLISGRWLCAASCPRSQLAKEVTLYGGRRTMSDETQEVRGAVEDEESEMEGG